MPVRSSRRLRTPVAALALPLLLVASACSPTPPAPAGSAPSAAFPLTVTNCGTDLTFDAAPQRIFLIGADSIPLLDAVGALDRVVSRTGDLPSGVYDAELQRAVDAIPTVESAEGATGGAVISSEVVLAAEPDLVIGPTNGVDSGTLTAAGVPIYTPPAYCPDGTSSQTGTATYQWVEDQLTEYGRMLGAPDAAATASAGLQQRIDQLADRTSTEQTAAALYIPAGGSTLYPYGAPSMVTPVFTSAGLQNVYADNQQRVFEASAEDLLERDPDVIVLLSSGSSGTEIRDFTAIPATRALAAVQQNRIVTLPFAYTDPPTPLSVTGAEKLAEQLTR